MLDMTSESNIVFSSDVIPDDLLQSEALNKILTKYSNNEYSRNFLEIYYNRYMMRNQMRVTENDETDPEALQENNEQAERFYFEIVSYLKEHSGILIDINNGTLNFEIINTIYSMFIHKLHFNIIEFMTQLIIDNKNNIPDMFEKSINSNLSIKLARKKYKNKIDAIISVRFSEIVDLYLSDRNYMNPELLVNLLHQYSPEDYEYREVYNLFQIRYLSFDMDKFFNFIQETYRNINLRDRLHLAVIEKLLPTFKLIN